MKLLTILGTRPEIIRLSQIIPKLDQYTDQIIVHTGQNYDFELDAIFFQQLGLRKPDYFLNARGTFAEQIAKILIELEKIVDLEKPDKFLVLGDTNSSMGAIVMKRLGVTVYHMEAGNRAYDDRTPEEVNRRIIDHSSDILMPYTQDSRDRLVKEGVALNRIFVIGNPIYEVIKRYENQAHRYPDLFKDLDIRSKKYFLVTIHRQENVDGRERLEKFISIFHNLSKSYGVPVVVSTHPRLRKMITKYEIPINEGEIKLCKPFGFIEFLELQKHAACVLTDSGTVMEECTIFGVPCVVIRDSHERPECQESGSIVLTGCDAETINTGVEYVMHCKNQWTPPVEYLIPNVSDTVCKIILSKFYKG